jgi:hypothetical protein
MESNSVPPESQTPAMALPAEPAVPIDPYAPVRYSALQTSNIPPVNLPHAPPPPPTPSLSPAPPPPYSSSPSPSSLPSGGSAIVYQPAAASVYMTGSPPAAYSQIQQVGQMEGCVQVHYGMSPPSGFVICLGIFTCLCCGAGAVCGLVGFILALVAHSQFNSAQTDVARKSAEKLNRIGFVIAVLGFIIGILVAVGIAIAKAATTTHHD